MNIILTALSPFLFIYTLFDFLLYLIFKRNTNTSYRIFRKSFISTSGKINDFLSYLISVFSIKYNSKELNSLNSFDENEIDNFLINNFYNFGNSIKYFDKNYMRRLNVLPGMTGLLQINDRNTDDFEVWYKYDLEYIENWNLRLDVEILFRTITAVFNRKNSGK